MSDNIVINIIETPILVDLFISQEENNVSTSVEEIINSKEVIIEETPNNIDISITQEENNVLIEIEGNQGGGGIWGSITGDISNQLDLQSVLDSKQDLLSPDVDYLTPATAALTYQPIGSYLIAETDPVVGAISGIVKADGLGVISTALADVDYLTPDTAAATYQPIGSYLTVEVDPVFSASPAASISVGDITNLGNLSGTNSGDVTIGTPASGLSVLGQVVSIVVAATGVTGALSGTDWDTFNAKQAALSLPLAASLGGTGVTNGASATLTLPNVALTLAAAGAVTVTIPESLTVAGRDVANTFTALNNFKTALGIRLEGTGTNTNIIDLIPGVASSVARLDFFSGNANKGIVFQLLPNGTAANTQIVLGNQSSQTNFGSVILAVNGADAYLSVANIGTPTTPVTALSIGGGGTGTGYFSSITLQRTSLIVGASGDATINVRIQRFSPTGRAQITYETQDGAQLWRTGTTGGGGTDFNFYNGTTTNLTMQRAGDSYFPAGNVGIGGAPVVKLHTIDSTVTNGAIREVQRLEATISTANTGGAAGFGPGLGMWAETATDGTSKQQGLLWTKYVVPTNGSETAAMGMSAYAWISGASTAQEFISGEANSTGVKLGFYGVTRVARQLLATGVGATVDDVITALQTLGLVKQA